MARSPVAGGALNNAESGRHTRRPGFSFQVNEINVVGVVCEFQESLIGAVPQLRSSYISNALSKSRVQ